MFQLSHLVKSVVKFDIKCVFTHQGSLVCSANSVTRVFDGVFCKIQNLPCCTHKGKSKCQFLLKPQIPTTKISSFINTSYLTYISFLPSNWNLDKNFAQTGELGQVHMTKKIFLIFFLAGRWLFLLLNL